MNAPSSLLTNPRKVGLRADDFMLLAKSGAFVDYAKTELIDGDIYVVNAQHSPHARAKSRLLGLLINRLAEIGSELEALSEVTVRLSEDSMPEPDIVLTRWQGDGPVPASTVALVIEVSDSTLAMDLGRKSDLYAAAGIPEYWVVDLDEKRVLMHEHPDADGYHGQLDIDLSKILVSATIDGLKIRSDRLVN